MENGILIADAHNFVLRFNNAPTSGFDKDVGTMTSLRIVNSQVVTKAKFRFPYSSMYDDAVNNSLAIPNSDALWAGSKRYLIWDPCNYGSTFEQVKDSTDLSN